MLGGVVITSILGFYKKTSTPFNLTFSLCLVTDAIIKNDLQETIRLHVDNMLTTLFSQVSISPNI